MPQSLGQVYVHLVLSTEGCRPFLVDRDLRKGLHGYVVGILRNLGCQSLRVGGVDDHMHVLFRLSRVRPIAQVVQEVKSGTLSWVLRDIGDFHWQESYGAFSVSHQNVDRVVTYIKNQERYHQTVSFADEQHQMLGKGGGLEHAVNVHIVFSTKNRLPFLKTRTVRHRLHDFLAKACALMRSPSLSVGGIEDHVHILCQLSQHRSLAELVEGIKTRSSGWLSSHQDLRDFDWQDGYGAFSVSPQHVAAAIRYIENQEDHHRQETFPDECARLMTNPKSWESHSKKPHSPG